MSIICVIKFVSGLLFSLIQNGLVSLKKAELPHQEKKGGARKRVQRHGTLRSSCFCLYR